MGGKRRRGGYGRRALGALWLAGWIAALYLFVDPWRHLGGVESEWLRWLEGWALVTGIVLGFLLGRFGRDGTFAPAERSHVSLLRFGLYPPAAIAAIALVALRMVGESGPIGVVATAFLAYWAGLDIAFGAVPLMEGNDYALTRPLERDAPRPEPVSFASFPWERL